MYKSTDMKRHYFVFCKGDILLEKLPDGAYTIPYCEEPPTEVKPWTNIMTITQPDGTKIHTYRIEEPVSNSKQYEMCGLRPSYYKLSNELYMKAGKCEELLYWDQNTQYCGVWRTHEDAHRNQQAVYGMRQRGMAAIGYSHHCIDSQGR